MLKIAGENGDRQDEIGDRPGRDDRRAGADALAGKRMCPLRRIHCLDFSAIGNARLVLVAEELDVAAERDQRQPPARALAVVEAEQLRAEADREDLDRTPHQRATRKWPSSWKNTTIVRTNRNGRM